MIDTLLMEAVPFADLRSKEKELTDWAIDPQSGITDADKTTWVMVAPRDTWQGQAGRLIAGVDTFDIESVSRITPAYLRFAFRSSTNRKYYIGKYISSVENIESLRGLYECILWMAEAR